MTKPQNILQNPEFGKRIQQTVGAALARPYAFDFDVDRMADIGSDKLGYALGALGIDPTNAVGKMLWFLNSDDASLAKQEFSADYLKSFLPHTVITAERNSSVLASMLCGRYATETDHIPTEWLMQHARFLMGDDTSSPIRRKLYKAEKVRAKALDAFFESIIYPSLQLPDLKFTPEVEPVVNYLATKGEERAKILLYLSCENAPKLGSYPEPKIVENFKFNANRSLTKPDLKQFGYSGYAFSHIRIGARGYASIDILRKTFKWNNYVEYYKWQYVKEGVRSLKDTSDPDFAPVFWVYQSLTDILNSLLKKDMVKEAHNFIGDYNHLRCLNPKLFEEVEKRYKSLGFFKKLF